jgi:5-methyltetrahydrofolate--homocysteine methyltransferase
MTILLKGRGEPLTLDPAGQIRTIGERINPSGRKKLQQALASRDWAYVAAEAQRQVEAGADIIDVNAGGLSVDEAAVFPEVVRAVTEAVEVPLCIDTRVPEALEAALAVSPGRPLVNSISGEKSVLERILPIVAQRGLPVIALCIGGGGIPGSAEERVKVAHDVLEAATRAGLKSEDVLFDPIVMSVGADDQAARVTLETIRRLRQEFPGHSITGGASNISFGMPARAMLNASFIAVAAVLGMNVPITDVTYPELRFALLAADVFLGQDKRTRRFVRHIRSQKGNP